MKTDTLYEIQKENVDKAFIIESKDTFDSNYSKHFEGLFTQGNGYMDVRGSFEEGVKSVDQSKEYDRRPANVTLEKHDKQAQKWGTYIPGIAGKHPNLATEIINLPFFFDTEFYIDNEKLDMEESCISDYSFELNMKDGSLRRSFLLKAESASLKFEYFRFLSLAEKHLAVSEIKVSVVEGTANVEYSSGINAKVRTNGFNHFEQIKTKVDNGLLTMDIATNGKSNVRMVAKVDSYICNSQSVSLINTGKYIEDEIERIAETEKLVLESDDKLIIQKVVCITSDKDVNETEDYITVSKNIMNSLPANLNDIYKEHVKAWEEKWLNSDILIEGNDDLQKALRISIYHLMRSCCDDNPNVAICAKGYAGEAYFGRYFWDTEINMLPFFIYTNPKAARSLIEFRYKSLEGAKRNAKAYGYNGARYAWESSVSGDEECMNWQYCDHEVHVTADIIYAIDHYVKATKDTEFLKQCGAEIMVETSRYWQTRVDKDKEGRYVLLGVMGPDEYLPMTQNNVYTNYMVKYAVKTTVETLKWLKESDSNAYGSLINKTGLTKREIEDFKDLYSNIKIAFDENTDIILQCDEFLNYADIDFDKVWTDRKRCFGEFISQERNYRSKALKQADVLEMMMLFPNDFTDKQVKANYEYYEPITTHDSSLSAFVHALIAGKLGKDQDVLSFMQKVMETDCDTNKKGAEEGIHIANCGGLWQLVVFGFAGLKTAMWSDEVSFSPNLPDGITKITLSLIWKGERKIYTIS